MSRYRGPIALGTVGLLAFAAFIQCAATEARFYYDWPGVMVLLVAVAALGLSIGPVWAIGIAQRRVDE